MGLKVKAPASNSDKIKVGQMVNIRQCECVVFKSLKIM